MNAPSDEQLVKDFLDGRSDSFELIVRRHTQELHQFVYRFTTDRVAAEDVVQETFLQVYNAAASFDPQRRFKPWLFTIAANKARDYLRKLGRRREVPFEASVGGEDSGQRFLDLFSGADVLPHEEMVMEEERQVVRSVMEAMPEKYAEVLILAYYHRFAYKDIAEVIGIPLGTVKSRLHAAIAHFCRKYKEAVAAELKRDDGQ